MKKIITASIISILCLSISAQEVDKDREESRIDLILAMNKIKNESLMRGILGVNAKKISFFSFENSSYYQNKNDACKINFQLDEKGKLESILDKNFNKLDYFKNILISPHEEIYFIDFYSRYLMGGCNYAEYKNPIILSKDKKANEAINLIFGHIENDYGISINSIFQDNYANALATIQLILNYGTRDEVLSTLRKTSILNDTQSTLWSLSGSYRIKSGTAIKILLLPENIKKIRQISQNDSEKIKLFALQIASVASVYDISTLDINLIEQLFNLDNINLIVAIKTYDLIKNTMPEIFKQDFNQAKNVNTYTEVISQEIFKKITINGELDTIKKLFKNLESKKFENTDSLTKETQSLEKHIKEIIYKEINNNNEFLTWKLKNNLNLINDVIIELREYDFLKKRMQSNKSLTVDELLFLAKPELNIYKDLLNNKIPILFYQNYHEISEQLGLVQENNKKIFKNVLSSLY